MRRPVRARPPAWVAAPPLFRRFTTTPPTPRSVLQRRYPYRHTNRATPCTCGTAAVVLPVCKPSSTTGARRCRRPSGQGSRQVQDPAVLLDKSTRQEALDDAARDLATLEADDRCANSRPRITLADALSLLGNAPWQTKVTGLLGPCQKVAGLAARAAPEVGPYLRDGKI